MSVFFFFFQAEDGIRDYKVTGVQTCALPISVAAGTRKRSATAPAGTVVFVPRRRQAPPDRLARVVGVVGFSSSGSASAAVTMRSPEAARSAQRWICSGLPNLAIAAAPTAIELR